MTNETINNNAVNPVPAKRGNGSKSIKESLASVSNAPADANVKSMEAQANSARGAKSRGKRLTTIPVDKRSPLSVELVDILASFLGISEGKRDDMYSSEPYARVTPDDWTSITNQADDAKLSFGQFKEGKQRDIELLRKDVSRYVVRVNVSMERLREAFPASERKSRQSAVPFEFTEETETRTRYNITTPNLVNVVQELLWSRTTKTGHATINGNEIAISMKRAIEAHPERFTAEGVYIPVKESTSGADSATTPDRECYILTLNFEDGSSETLDDYGIKNFLKKIMSRQHSKIVPVPVK